MLFFFFFFFFEFGLLSTVKLQDMVGELRARDGVHNHDAKEEVGSDIVDA